MGLPERPWWADEHYPEASITLVTGASLDEVATHLGLDLSAAPRLTFDECYEMTDYLPGGLQVDVLGHAVVLVEPNGFQPIHPDWVTGLSGGEQAVSLCWTVNRDATFTLARHGSLVRSFDPVLEHEEGGTGERLPEEEGLPWDADPIAAAGELQARVAGAMLTRKWLLETPHPSLRTSWYA